MSSLDHLLESYRADAISKRDKGAAFEKLIVETTEAPWSENARAVESAELRAVTATGQRSSKPREDPSPAQLVIDESVSDADAIEMLAQHLITRPVFDAVFEGDDELSFYMKGNTATGWTSVIRRSMRTT